MTDEKAVPKRRGRPPKKAIQEKKKPGKVGRPTGDADAIREYKARLLASPKSRKVMDSILRIMPLSYFDEARNTGGKAAVNITITGVGGDTTIIGEQEDALDGDFINLNPGENEDG